MRARLFGLLAAGAALVALAATPARADAIDGDWCKADGKRMKIRGPQIITPGGKETSGDYTRHSFVYVVPRRRGGRGRDRVDHPAVGISRPCASRRRRRAGPGLESLPARRR